MAADAPPDDAPYRDPGRSDAERAADLLGRMTVAEKIAQLTSVWLTLDPSSGGNATGSWTVPYRCTKGTTSGGVTVDTTSRTLTADTPANGTISYSIALAGGTQVGDGFGAAAATRDLTVNYTVTNAAFADKAADTYRDTITLSITP